MFLEKKKYEVTPCTNGADAVEMVSEEQFDIIFLDPPYHMDVIDEIIQTIAKQNLLKEDGIIVCLYSKNNSLEVENNGIIEYKKKTIGVTKVSYMRWGNEYENSSLSR